MPKVLIVDDNEENREVLRYFFRLFDVDSGIVILEAFNGEDAVKMVEKQKPELVLMDIKMETDYAGLTATRKIRENPLTSKTVIWALTSQAMEAYDNEMSDRAKCLEAGCDDYISKPFDQLKLLQDISKLLNIPIPERIKKRFGM
jgi:CheY-like chemotaxis protein